MPEGLRVGAVWAAISLKDQGYSRGLATAKQGLSDLDRETEKYTRDSKGRLHDAQGRFVGLGTTIEGTSQTMKRSALEVEGAWGKLGGWVSTGAKVVTGAVIAAGAAGTALGVSSVMTAARVQEMNIALGQLGRTAGIEKRVIDSTVRSIRERGVTTQAAQQLTSQFIRGNLDLAKATDLARVAQDAAIFTQQDSSEVLQELLHGIQTGNTNLDVFENLNIRAGKAIEDFGISIGKSSGELTQAERQQALLNAVLKAGIPIAGAYDAAMSAPGKQLRSWPRYAADIKESIGNTLLPAWTDMIGTGSDLLKTTMGLVSEGGALRPVLDRIGRGASNVISPVTGAARAASNWLKQLRPEQIRRFADRVGGLVKIAGYVAPPVLAGVAAWKAWNTAMLISRTVTPLVTLATGLLHGVMTGQITVTEGLTLAQLHLNTAMLMNPIGLVVVGIAALGAGFALAYAKIEPFRRVVDRVFGGLRDFGGWIWEHGVRALKDFWRETEPVRDRLGDLVGLLWRFNPTVLFVKGLVEGFRRLGGWLDVIAQNAGFRGWLDVVQNLSTGAMDTLHRAVRGISDKVTAFKSSQEWKDFVSFLQWQAQQKDAAGEGLRISREQIEKMADKLGSWKASEGWAAFMAWSQTFSASELSTAAAALKQISDLTPANIKAVSDGMKELQNFKGDSLDKAGRGLGKVREFFEWVEQTPAWKTFWRESGESVGSAADRFWDLAHGIEAVVGWFGKLGSSSEEGTGRMRGTVDRDVPGVLGRLQGLSSFIGGGLGLVWSRSVQPAWEGALGTSGFLPTLTRSFIERQTERIQAFGTRIGGIFLFTTGLIQGDWRQMWEGLNQIAAGSSDGLTRTITGLRDRIVGLFTGLRDAVGNLVGVQMVGRVRDGLNWGIDRINSFLGLVFDKEHGLGRFGVSGPGPISRIEAHARGGEVKRPTLSWLAEEGHPETVIPHDPSLRSRALDLWKAAGHAIGAFGKLAMGGPGGSLGEWWSGSYPLAQGPGGAFSHARLNAWDYMMPTGTPLKMGLAGTVMPGPGGGYGVSAGINLDKGGSLVLGHLQRLIKTGRVRVGETFATSDSTGFSTGPHVHFEVRNSPLQPGAGGGGGIDVHGMIQGWADRVISGMGGGEPGWMKGLTGSVIKSAVGGLGDWVGTNFSSLLSGASDFAGEVLGRVIGRVTKSMLAQLMQRAGWNPEGGVEKAFTIMMRESGGNPRAIGPSWHGDAGSRGPFQIQPGAHPWADLAKLFDPLYNVQAAKRIYDVSGWRAWSTSYDTGGPLPPGISVVNNATGRNEQIFNDHSFRRLEMVLDLVAKRLGSEEDDGRRPINLTLNIQGSVDDPEKLAREIGKEVGREVRFR